MNYKIEGFESDIYVFAPGTILEDNTSNVWILADFKTTGYSTGFIGYFFNVKESYFIHFTKDEILKKGFKPLNVNYKLILSNGTIQ